MSRPLAEGSPKVGGSDADEKPASWVTRPPQRGNAVIVFIPNELVSREYRAVSPAVPGQIAADGRLIRMAFLRKWPRLGRGGRGGSCE